MNKKTSEHIFDDVLNNLSTVEIAQLKNMLDREVSSLDRAKQIKKHLNKDMLIEFFCPDDNKFKEGRLITVKQKNALISYGRDIYEVPLFSLKTIATASSDNHKRLSKHHIETNQIVGFKDKNDNMVLAKVIRINDKTVTVIDQDRHKWRVPYSLLFNVTNNSPSRVFNHLS
jgi:hypothetical protein